MDPRVHILERLDLQHRWTAPSPVMGNAKQKVTVEVLIEETNTPAGVGRKCGTLRWAGHVDKRASKQGKQGLTRCLKGRDTAD